MQGLRHFLLALQFFTRIPVTGWLAEWVGFSPALLRASAAHFPAVGLVVGAVAALAYGGLALALPLSPWSPAVAAALSTVATVLLTGGFHEDGLSDLADGLGGSHQRERALEIMKDSRIGAFGAMALVLALLSKVALLALLGGLSLALVLATVLAAHVASRTWPLLTIASLAHVGNSATSKSKPLADQLPAGALGTGLLWCALVGVALWWWRPDFGPLLLAGLLASLLGWAVVHWRLKVRLQGFTGDGLGACQQVGELAFYLGVALAWPA